MDPINRTPLTSSYLASQKLSFKDLKVVLPASSSLCLSKFMQTILLAHHGLQAFPPGQYPASSAKARSEILHHKISVDWGYVVDGTHADMSSSVDKVFRILLEKKVISGAPENPESPLSSPPRTPVVAPKPMEVDFPFHENVHIGEDGKKVSTFLCPTDEDLCRLYDSSPLDKYWVPGLVIKDLTADARNPLSQFIPAVDELQPALQAYGLNKDNHCVVVLTPNVVHYLKQNGFCPDGPWDLFWCLLGYPTLHGPIARSHHAEAPVQLDLSQAGTREIPVMGDENGLRVMLVFKHPENTAQEIEGLRLQADDSQPAVLSHPNQITPYGAKPKPDSEEEEDLKPAKKARYVVRESTQVKNDLIIETMTQYFSGPNYPLVDDIRKHASTRSPLPAHQVWSWIVVIHDLKSSYTKMYIPGTPTTVLGKSIKGGHWQTLFQRGTSFMSGAESAYQYIYPRRNEVGISEFLASDTPVGVETIVKAVEKKAYLTRDELATR
ncbi:hypothetical protein R3P38DRAFT_3165055 [Favolaschia claudopus]|uniref:Uncharacterized protein n=1 Tax=Favolaschia claudopus TaxID=2862362 RepID=A0AAW0EHB7_9AGAR